MLTAFSAAVPIAKAADRLEVYSREILGGLLVRFWASLPRIASVIKSPPSKVRGTSRSATRQASEAPTKQDKL